MRSHDAPAPAPAASNTLQDGGPRAWPTDIPQPAPANAPRVLRELTRRLERYLEAPAKWLPGLNLVNGSHRQQRIERRIACVQLVRAMAKYCDLRTLRLGVPGQDDWIDFKLSYFADQAGLDQRRAERALRDLQAAGLAKVRQQCERIETDDGERFKGHAAIKYLPARLFDAFGLGKWLRHERQRAHLRAQRNAARQHKQDRRAAQVAGQLLGAIGKGRGKSTPANDTEHQQAEYRRMLMLRAGSLKAQHPEWDRDACYAEASRQLRPPD
ncbi:Crp/Fnr family transcriptional regulator [Burkholderia cepacia]|uniref:Crp/Fnr family transcriptional regulator n=1 Tax=Burkholderia cepacia TaxID=292 RepID=UPI002ABE0816|nr:Crp/Fnr family transcriptional regulator [Burkholderia cepacia]